MKNKLLLSGILAAMIVLPNVSFAEEVGVEAGASTSVRTYGSKADVEARLKAKAELEAKRKAEAAEKRDTIKSNIDAKREAIKGEIEERRENVKEKIKDRLDKFIQNIVERLEAAVSRLEKLADRINSRIAKLEADGADMTKSKALMVEAEAKIEVAKASVAAIEVDANATTTATIKASFPNLKAQIEKAKTDIKAAHAALVEVVRSLKPGQARIDAKVEAESNSGN